MKLRLQTGKLHIDGQERPFRVRLRLDHGLGPFHLLDVLFDLRQLRLRLRLTRLRSRGNRGTLKRLATAGGGPIRPAPFGLTRLIARLVASRLLRLLWLGGTVPRKALRPPGCIALGAPFPMRLVVREPTTVAFPRLSSPRLPAPLAAARALPWHAGQG